MLQSADKFLKAVCQMGNLVVVFLIHMDCHTQWGVGVKFIIN